MNIAVCLLLYGAALTWLGPRVLAPLTRRGLSPRLSLTVWLTAVALSVLAWLATGVGLLLGILGIPLATSEKFCVDMILAVGHLSWTESTALNAMAAMAAILTVTVALRSVVAGRRSWARSREHADAARLLGSHGGSGDAVILPSSTPTAYCVAGRPDAIVVTTGALAVLGDAELAAILAHERAHLRGRHPQLLMLCRALATTMPRLPLFPAAFTAAGRLLEMRADDVAVRRHGSATLLGGLLSLVDPLPANGVAVGAADTAVLERAARLVEPATLGARLRHRIAVIATLAGLVLAPVLIMAICHR